MTDAEARTRAWVEQVVVRLGLCPFATAPLLAGRVRFATTFATDPDAVYRDCLGELLHLVENNPDTVETTLVIVPHALARFDDYLDMLASLEAAIEQAGLAGEVQVASFHPDYVFEGAAAEDPANYTNRSPHPTFHLIREAGLAAALEGYPEPERIPERNAARLRELGTDALRSLLHELRGSHTDTADAPDRSATR